MKGLRWGAVLSVVGGVLLTAGCQSPVKMVSRDTYDNFMRLQRMNESQGAIITSLQNEKVRLMEQLGHQTEMVQTQQRLLDELQSKTAAPVETGGFGGGPGVSTIQTTMGPGIRMDADLLFDAGSANLKPQGEKVLKSVADFVQKKPNKLAVNGYSDSDPIKHSGWKSNFDLSGARALAVLDYLKKQGVEPSRMHFAGYGEYDLITDASGKENKKASRRAEIILMDEMAAPVAPAKSSKSETVVPK